jgi:hypothetical protein
MEVSKRTLPGFGRGLAEHIVGSHNHGLDWETELRTVDQ